MSHNLHLFIQPRGGVGKSFLAAQFAQHLLEQGRGILCIGTAHAGGICGYQNLPCVEIDPVKTPSAYDQIGSHLVKQDVIVDLSSLHFGSLAQYIEMIDLGNVIDQSGDHLIAHVPITTSDLKPITQIHTLLPTARIVIWLNPIQTETLNLNEGSAEYQSIRSSVAGIIRLPYPHPRLDIPALHKISDDQQSISFASVHTASWLDRARFLHIWRKYKQAFALIGEIS
jgi:hypothetical protein